MGSADESSLSPRLIAAFNYEKKLLRVLVLSVGKRKWNLIPLTHPYLGAVYVMRLSTFFPFVFYSLAFALSAHSAISVVQSNSSNIVQAERRFLWLLGTIPLRGILLPLDV
jgi:hypothetical protein